MINSCCGGGPDGLAGVCLNIDICFDPVAPAAQAPVTEGGPTAFEL